MTELIVPRRFRGPASSGNGGWTAGALAGMLDHDCPEDRSSAWPTIRVTLRRPPPLDTRLTVQDGVASHDDGVVATAELVDDELEAVAEVDPATAAAARTSYAGLTTHPFPGCFACGPEREQDDGLRIFPGRVEDDPEGRVRVASTWTPHQSHAEDWHAYVDDHLRASLPVTWAALDCVGGWVGDLTERPMVLGRITTRVDTLPVVGEPHVVVRVALGGEGRKTYTAATLYDADGRVVALAEHVWVAVDPVAFNQLRA